MKKPVRIAVTGAAGQIGYSLLFRIASGEMLGEDQPVSLQLMEITPALEALRGVVMEINDCAYPLVTGIEVTDDPEIAFGDAEFIMLVGARPRSKGMERGDLLTENGKIFKPQGQAINAFANKDVKVLVIGNPANTNALIAMNNAPDIQPSQFTAMTRLDHNRAVSQVAEKTGAKVTDIKKVAIWGNHSATQYPDLNHATINGTPAIDQLDESWVKESFIPRVQKRGAEIIEARGLSSAASAAYAGLEHVRDWVNGTAPGEWVSMAVPSDGSYDVPEGLIYSFPVTIEGGRWCIVPELDIDEFSRDKMAATQKELEEERDAVKALI